MSIRNKLIFIIPITLTGIIIFNNKTNYTSNKYYSTSCGLTAFTISKILIQSNSKYDDSIYVTNVINLHEILESNSEGFFNITINSVLTNKSMNTKIIGHVMIIQKICKDKYKIYQSFLNYYSLNEYLTLNDKILNEKDIINVFKELYKLTILDDNDVRTLNIVKKNLLLDEQNFDNFFCCSIKTNFISYDKINDISIKYETKTFLDKINLDCKKLQNEYDEQYMYDNNDKINKLIYAVLIGLLFIVI